jgi:hypothetical protein
MTDVADIGQCTCMDVAQDTTGWNRVYSLWHIPSSTLLVTTLLRDVVARRIESALTAGFQMDDLMLQITPEGELIGHQHLGQSIAMALQQDNAAALYDREGA